MPIYEVNGRRANVKDASVNKFLSRYPDAQLIDNQPYSIVRTGAVEQKTDITEQPKSGEREKQIEKQIEKRSSGISSAKRYDIDIPDYGASIGKNLPKMSSGNNKDTSLNTLVGKSMREISRKRASESDRIVDSAINEYESYKNWINDINNDAEISDEVKKQLNEWYAQNFRDTDNSTDQVRTPILVKDWLENNKQTVSKSVYVPGSPMFGGGTYAKGTAKENTPQQMAMIADFLVNSPKGRLIARDEKQYLQQLDESIDQLEKEIGEAKKKRDDLTPANVGIKNYLLMSKQEKEMFNNEREALRADIEKQYPYADRVNARNQLNELKKLRAAYEDKDKGFIRQMANEFGRRLGFDLVNAASLGTVRLTEEEALANALKNPDNKLTRKAFDLVGQYQQAHQLDRSIAQDIAQGTSYMLPYIAQFAATEGISSAAVLPAVKGVAANVGTGTGGRFTSAASKELLKTGARTFLMPQTLTDAYAGSIDNPGSFLDAYAKSFVTNYAENLTEAVGEYIPGLKIKGGTTVGNVMKYTGTHGMVGELAEEQLATALHSTLDDGQPQWSDLVDPRNQAVTLGTVAMMQLPYVSIAAGGYAAGKVNNIQQKRSIRKGYNSNLTNMNNVFGQESAEIISAINETADSDTGDGSSIDAVLNIIAQDRELTEAQKDAAFKYTLSYIAMSSLNKAKGEEVERARLEAAQRVEENINAQMNALVSAKIGGHESPVQAVNGKIVQNEDGSIDRELSDQSITIIDSRGKRLPVSINYVENISENIPAQEAIDRAARIVSEPILAKQENEEVRPYMTGETIRFSLDGMTWLTGRIGGQDHDTGNYIVMTEAHGSSRELAVEPRFIVNEDNLLGVENGSRVQYLNDSGVLAEAVVATNPDLYAQGLIGFENGDVIKTGNVIGLAQNADTAITDSRQDQTGTDAEPVQASGDVMIAENGTVPYNPNDTVTNTNEPRVFEIEEGLSAVEKTDGTYALDKQFAKSELKKADSLVQKLNEDYSDNGLVFETVQLPKKDETNPFEKTLWGIVARMQQKTVSNSQPTANDNASLQPLERKQEKVLKQDTRAKKPTPFQRRLQAVEPNVSTVRDRILYGISSGAYKFQWKDKGVSMGLARELGLTSETERRSRISLLSNDGYTPSTLAHRIWEDTGSVLNDNDIRSEVIEVLSSISSRKQALETLESSLNTNEDAYYREQQHAAEFEQEQIRQAQAYQDEISDQLAAEKIENLLNLADELGLPLEELGNTYTASDLITQLEQSEEIQNEQEKDIHTRTEGTSEKTDSLASRSGNSSETTERKIGERDRPSEETGDRISDRDSQNDYSDLIAEGQRIVDNQKGRDLKDDKPRQEQDNATLQSTYNIFKPVDEQTLHSLADRLRQTGLARDVVTDKATFDAKLNEVINDNATAKQTLSEMDTIKQEAIANGTFMLAANGKPTKLNENQWLQVRTMPFLDWFGDWINNPEAASKVVDENGEPMVVYHATQSNFGSFSKRSMGKAIDQGTLGSGFYFTSSSENASVYAQNLHTNTGKRGGESIMPVFLSIINPYDAQLLLEVSGDNKKEPQSFTDKKKRQGYDGAKFEHRYDFAWFVAYEPTQIKSAISNNGEFDSSNPDIRMQVLNTNFDDRVNNPIGIEEMEQLGFSDLFYKDTPDPKLLKKFNSWLKDNPNAVLRLYHGTSDSIPIEEEGLKRTSTVRRRSFQSESGYVYLSPFKETAKIFGETGNPYGNTVYEVLMPVRLLKPDTDQLNNQRKEGKDIGKTLADSIVYGRSVRVKGDIPPYLIHNNVQFMRTNAGDVYGFVTHDGTVYLDAGRMNANTPIHEFGHLWNSFTKENNAKLYNQGAELVKESEYWERVNTNPAYKNLSDQAKIDEALAMAIGDKGEAITNRNLKQQFVDWLSEVWQSVKRAFGINTNVSLADMTLDEFTDIAVAELLGGKSLTDNSVQSKETRMQSVNDSADATNSTMTEEVRNQLDRRIKNFHFRIREAWEDRHLAVKEFLDTLRENGVDIAEYNDYYKQATHINGKIDAQLEHYNEKFQKPLNKAISDLEKEGFDYREIENYAILKHGLERNEWMRQNAINQYKENNPEATQEQIDKYAEKLPDDYSGITAVQEEVGMNAEEFIAEFENKAGKKLTDNFWKKVKDTTQYSISKQLEGGLIDKKTFDDLINRYDYYIPLRGHDAETAEDRWDYSPNMGTYFVAPLVKAKGRKTRSESPFAYIFSMAQSSINSANRNWLNQTMLRLARKDTTGLMGVGQSWYVMDGMNADGVPTYKVESPTFSENPEQYRKNIEEFEQRMQKLAEQGFAYPSGSKLDIGGMFIKRSQADQHEVHVWQNGKEFTVYINANPAVARAINGVNAKDLHKDRLFIAKVSRQMAANFTTRNPIFVATNFSRDYLFASSILAVKEDARYAIQFQRNIPRSASALQRYIRGKADLTKKQDRYVIEYIMNGGKTGFSHIVELDKIQKRIEREIKNGESKNVFRSFLDVLEGCNEFAENLSRLSVYITSREQGRSITQSISDAKEVTVNFNRSGAGGYGAAWFRSLYLFVNAGIQALSNFAKVAQKNKGKTAMLISSYAMTGFLMPMLTALIGGDDGLDEYMKLSDWERQNNLCIYTGKGFIKIPLPHELRVFHAMGDNIYQAAFARKDIGQTLQDIVKGFADLIPANPMGAIQGSWAEIMPDATKPFFQLQANRNFTGGRIVNEWADPNKPGYLRVRTNKKGESYAPAFLVKLGQSLDAATGGDGVEKGLISFNPDVVNHLMRGYFGGLYTMGTQVLNLASKAYDWSDTGEFKIKIRETPLNTFYASRDDLQTASSALNSKYFKIAKEIQETGRKIKGYKQQVQKGQIGMDKFAEKIQGMQVETEKHNRIYPLVKQINKFESALKDLDGEDQKQAEIIIRNLKNEVITINGARGKQVFASTEN